ncbi:hypothetical protein QBC37DRAFT_54228 [Rhypophila decipiens]|uniref:Uncharacterized protein n=1 Tax=Rhypophila decipiens TaxID=261697 RepID=A0AAN6Y3G5_9PEZI|nr:hypothetical protein QBC37DRAFT_54228 [Rhypophila decipiens]
MPNITVERPDPFQRFALPDLQLAKIVEEEELEEEEESFFDNSIDWSFCFSAFDEDGHPEVEPSTEPELSTRRSSGSSNYCTDPGSIFSHGSSVYSRSNTPTPPDSDSESDDEDFCPLPFDVVRQLTATVLAEIPLPDNEYNSIANNVRDNYESSALLSDPEDEDQQEDQPAEDSTSETDELCPEQDTEIAEFSEDWEIVVEFERDGFEAAYAISNTGRRYWRKENRYKLLTDAEIEDLLEWVTQTGATPVYMKPGLFTFEEYWNVGLDPDTGEARQHPLIHTGAHHPDWAQHSWIDENGHILLLRDYDDERFIAQGYKCQRKASSWATMDSPSSLLNRGKRQILPSGQLVPEPIVTSPEGEVSWPEDLAYYPGQVSWADLDDDDDELAEEAQEDLATTGDLAGVSVFPSPATIPGAPRDLYTIEEESEEEEAAENTDHDVSSNVTAIQESPDEDIPHMSLGKPAYGSDDETLFENSEDDEGETFNPLPLTGAENPSWKGHSSIDVHGQVYVIRDYQNWYHSTNGLRLSTKTSWVVMESPSDLLNFGKQQILPSGQTVPELTITTPEGEIGWLEDLAYYPDQTNRADDDGDEEPVQESQQDLTSCTDLVSSEVLAASETGLGQVQVYESDENDNDDDGLFGDGENFSEDCPPLPLTGHLNPGWALHSCVDEDGKIFLTGKRQWEDYFASGGEVQCQNRPNTWVSLPSRDLVLSRVFGSVKLSNGLPVPELTFTTPEGETCWLDDTAYYPGQTNWADMDDDDE